MSCGSVESLEDWSASDGGEAEFRNIAETADGARSNLSFIFVTFRKVNAQD
jgi:hypothetical protein